MPDQSIKSMSHTLGRVILVGAGPGSADLITLRGANWLAKADVVLFDALTDPALRELAPQAQWISVGKRGYDASTEQAQIHELLIHHAQRSAVVVRLKGGDPSLFARSEEELLALHAAGITTEVVPGVTAALAAAAQTQRPLTRRETGRSVTLTTAMTAHGDAPLAAARADTEVFYMAGRKLATLGRKLIKQGWAKETPVLVVSRAGSADSRQSAHTLATLVAACELHMGHPTVVTVGVGASPLNDKSGEALKSRITLNIPSNLTSI
jgi:uroporphyrin-III C-methyltransferase